MSASAPAAAPANWYAALPRKLHLDYHQPDWMTGVAAAITPEAARAQAKMFRAAGVQAVSVFVYDHHAWSFYPDAKVGRSHPGLAQDYVGHMVQALKAEGIRPMAYINVYGHTHLAAQHPDWFIQSPDGHHTGGAWLQYPHSHLCASSPALREHLVPLVGEILARYDLEAIWFDGGTWLIETPCVCAHCQREFKSATGLDLPTRFGAEVPRRPSAVRAWRGRGPADDQRWTIHDEETRDHAFERWRMWRRDQARRFVHELVAGVKAIKPGILVTDNNAGRWSMGLPMLENGRVTRWVPATELGIDYMSCDPLPFGGNHALGLSLEGRHQATTGLPFDFMNVRFHKWGEWQLRSTVDYQLEFATILAIGGRCYFADQPYPDGTLEPEVYRRLQAAYAFVQARESFVLGAELVPEVAILASAPSQQLGPIGTGFHATRFDTGLVGSTNEAKRKDRIEGAHLYAVGVGLQALIYDEPTLRSALDRQALVIVPEQCLLEEATLAALIAYVERGGALLVTGRSGAWDQDYAPRDLAALDAFLGIERHGALASPVHYLRWRGPSGLPDFPVQLWGNGVHVRARDAEVLAELYAPRAEVWREGVADEAHWRHYTTFGACPPAAAVLAPAITLRPHGRGKVAFCAIDPFALYAREGHVLLRQVVDEVIERLHPRAARRVSADKPLNVELVLQRQGERDIVHLLNSYIQKHLGPQVHAEDFPAARDLTVRIRRSTTPRRVTLEPGAQPVQFAYAGGVVTARIPEVAVHAMLVCE